MHEKYYSEKVSTDITRLKEVQNPQCKWNLHGETRILSCEQVFQGNESQWGFSTYCAMQSTRVFPDPLRPWKLYFSFGEILPPNPKFFFFFFEGKDFSGAEGNSNFAWICLESLDFFNTFLFVFAVFVNWHSKRQCADLGLEGLGSFFFHQKGQKNGCRF